MIMISIRGMLMGVVFPLTGFNEMPKAVSIPQQPVQQPLQQPVQQTPQPQLSATSIPPELTPRLHNISRDQIIRAMQARSGGAGAMFQPGTVNPVAQQQIPSGLNLEMMQALMQRKQDGGG